VATQLAVVCPAELLIAAGAPGIVIVIVVKFVLELRLDQWL
jgi:hypothetical protein